MANGIKLRRGLKATLATTIADGEFVFCSDTGELGFKKGTSEVYVDLEKLTTDVDELQAKEVSLLPGQFKISINKFYDFYLNPESKPLDKGGFRIPLAKVNPLYIGNEFPLQQVFNFNNVSIKMYDFDSSIEFKLADFALDYMVIDTQSNDSGGFDLHYNGDNSSADFRLEILDDGYDNFSIWLEVSIDNDAYNTRKVILAFDMDCISEVGENKNLTYYNVFLPPLGLEITPYKGAA